MPAQVKPVLKAVGGSDHLKQYMDTGVNGRNLRVAIHNMTDRCTPNNNAWGAEAEETPDEYTARLQWMGPQYAQDFKNGTDVLMLQEAPNTPAEAENLFKYIIQANPGVPLNYRYSTNGRGQGMMTIYNAATMEIAPNQATQDKSPVQSTSFTFHGQAVTTKNVHLAFQSPDNSAAQLTHGKPNEVVIRGGDHNGSPLKFNDLKTAEVGPAATSVSHTTNGGRFFTGDPKNAQVGTKYDGFAVTGPNVSITKIQSVGSFSLENNRQAGNNLVYTPNPNLNLSIPTPAKGRHADLTANLPPQPKNYVVGKTGLIQCQFNSTDEANRFAKALYDVRHNGGKIAERGEGHNRQKYANLVNGVPTIRLTKEECTKLLASGLLSQEKAAALKNAASGLKAPNRPVQQAATKRTKGQISPLPSPVHRSRSPSGRGAGR
jgi:hypothetical protein